MDRARFRSDPALRPSGYHLATWSTLAAAAAFLRATTALDSARLHVLLLIALVVLGWLLALSNERRAAKIVPEAIAEAFPAARSSFWMFAVLGTLAVVAAALVETSRSGLWTALLGGLLAAAAGMAINRRYLWPSVEVQAAGPAAS